MTNCKNPNCSQAKSPPATSSPSTPAGLFNHRLPVAAPAAAEPPLPFANPFAPGAPFGATPPDHRHRGHGGPHSQPGGIPLPGHPARHMFGGGAPGPAGMMGYPLDHQSKMQAYLRGFPGAASLFAAAGMPGFPGGQRERSRSPIRDDRQEEF